MITPYDEAIIAFYFVFVLTVGLLFKRLSKSTSDYFRAGGAMPWWITGTSAWIAGFSAWTFTGAAGKVYETGSLVLVLYYANVLGLAMVYLYTCTRFRRLRVVTWMEAVRARYGKDTEQFYTWIKLPLLLLFSGVGLNAIGVFISSVFHVQIQPVLVILGVAVTIVAVTGGAFAVLASDFVQMFLVMTITLVVAYLTLHLPQVGGIENLLRHVPSRHFHWTEIARPELLTLWGLVMIWNGLAAGNNVENATMYLMAKSDRDAKRMVLIPLIGSIAGPLIWFIPSMAATIVHPNLAAEFPLLKSPHEAAFVAMCMDVLPKGLIGLLICAMLGATLTSMDAGLNKGAGVFVRSFYLPVLNPACPEKKLLLVSKTTTLVFGAIIVFFAVEFSRFRTMGLFDTTNLLAACLGGPMIVPLLWGMFFKKTPAWSAATTTVIGFIISLTVYFTFDPVWFQHLCGWGTLNKDEVTFLQLGVSAFATIVPCSLWFFLTSRWYDKSPAEHKDRVDELFTRMDTPVNVTSEGVQNLDHAIYGLLGGLCLAFGGFILLLTAIPNNLTGRLCFVFCGGVVVIAGTILTSISRKLAVAAAARPVGVAEIAPTGSTV
ncbi:MAG: hypothetical protein P4L33_11465 [Capsulimonadaceae bacterium]|nr:hypothetical protein [Capsulimonadaceae bacterium]